jgi:hypothetical protein
MVISMTSPAALNRHRAALKAFPAIMRGAGRFTTSESQNFFFRREESGLKCVP